MSSSISSSDVPADAPSVWRRFFGLAAGSAAAFAAVVYLFVVVVDPWGMLPLSPPFDRVPVTGNQRFSYPMLARSPRFDSAILGTSTSRLLRPAALDPAFGARFVNLAMNAATPFEISSMFTVFRRAHKQPKIVLLGLDFPWCATGDSYQKLTERAFPAWMYGRDRWRGYGDMFNLFTVQEAGKQFGVLTGLKRPDMGRDGYIRFVPPDSQYDPARALAHLRADGVVVPVGERTGPPETWRFPALEVLRDDLSRLPAETHRILFFTPYNHRLLAPPGSAAAWPGTSASAAWSTWRGICRTPRWSISCCPARSPTTTTTTGTACTTASPSPIGWRGTWRRLRAERRRRIIACFPVRPGLDKRRITCLKDECDVCIPRARHALRRLRPFRDRRRARPGREGNGAGRSADKAGAGGDDGVG
jgi:hypothetical protein